MKRTELKRKAPMKPGKGFAAMGTELRRVRLAPASGKKAAGKAVGMRAAIRRKRCVPATRAQRARWDRMIRLGCVACLVNITGPWRLWPASFLRVRTNELAAEKLEIHHLLSGGKRLGHDFTVCLCRYHHQGDLVPDRGQRYRDQSLKYGPSLAHEGKRFREVYGDEAVLLTFQNMLIESAPE